MNAISHITKRNSIATRLLRNVFSIYLIIAISVTLGHMVMDYFYQKRSISSELENIERTFAHGLALDIWQLDQESLRSGIEGMLTIPIIVGVKIQNPKGEIIAIGGIIEKGKDVGNVGLHVNLLGLTPEEVSIHKDEEYSLNVFMYQFPISYAYLQEIRKLGEVTLYSNTSVIFQRVKFGFLLLIVNAFIKTAALWFIFLYFSNILLRRPLTTFANATKNVSLENLNFIEDIKTPGRNEIKALEESFNSMIGNLRESIIERDKSEKMVKEAFELNDKIISESPIGILIYDEGGQCVKANDSVAKIVGATKEQLLNQNFNELDSWKKTVLLNSAKTAIKDGITKRLEIQFITTFSKIIYIDSYFVPFLKEGKTNLMYMIVDISERIKAEEKITASLKEKNVLIDEIHHRVKNNMNVISSLLKLQANNINDERTKEILKESQNRIYAMSAIHETLHGSENLSEIDLKKYLFKITTSIFQASSIDPKKVKLRTDIEELPISIDQASPLGLIINELLSNSLKYAFPNDRTGEVNVSMKKLNQELHLTVMDDGVGMSDGLDWKNANTLGLKLVRTLVENQLDGSIDMESNNGTKFTIKFNIET